MIGFLTGATIILIGHPWTIFPSALVDGKTLWTAGMELQAYIGDVKGLSEMESKINGVGVLDPGQHGLALPPGAVGLVVVVGEEGGAVLQVRLGGVAQVAGLGDSSDAGLHAVLLGRAAARVSGHHGGVKGSVDELGHAALGPPALLIHTLVHGAAARPDQQQQEQPKVRADVHPAPFLPSLKPRASSHLEVWLLVKAACLSLAPLSSKEEGPGLLQQRSLPATRGPILLNEQKETCICR